MSTFSNVGSKITAGVLSFFSKVNSNANLLTIDPDDNRVQIDKFFGFGTLTTPTIASGVLTVTGSFVNPLPESSTSDTVDSIVMAGVQAGDVLLIHVPATNTITFDDANINLAAATRAVAPGGSLLLVYDGTEWSEVVFLAATDNA
ncbi:MAG: hypothetical protein AB7H92_14000 [Microbacteriaceae bacterium]